MRMQFDRWGASRARVQSEALKPKASIRAANPLGSSLCSPPEAKRRLSRRSLGEGGPLWSHHALDGSYDSAGQLNNARRQRRSEDCRAGWSRRPVTS
jgi:hypothetical protein